MFDISEKFKEYPGIDASYPLIITIIMFDISEKFKEYPGIDASYPLDNNNYNV